MEEKDNCDQLLSKLGPIIPPFKVCQLMQQTSTALCHRPAGPISRHEDARREAPERNRRANRAVSRQPDGSREPDRRFALNEDCVGIPVDLHGPAAQSRKHYPAAGQTDQQNHGAERPGQSSRQRRELKSTERD